MSYFQAKMRQIWCRLGLHLKTPLAELTVLSPDPIAGFKGPTDNGREGKKDGRAREGERGENVGKRRGGEEKRGGADDFRAFLQFQIVWNSLPSSVTSSTSLTAFRQRLKSELFLQCFGQDCVWRIFACARLRMHAFMRTFVKCSCSPLDFTTL